MVEVLLDIQVVGYSEDTIPPWAISGCPEFIRVDLRLLMHDQQCLSSWLILSWILFDLCKAWRVHLTPQSHKKLGFQFFLDRFFPLWRSSKSNMRHWVAKVPRKWEALRHTKQPHTERHQQLYNRLRTKYSGTEKHNSRHIWSSQSFDAERLLVSYTESQLVGAAGCSCHSFYWFKWSAMFLNEKCTHHKRKNLQG